MANGATERRVLSRESVSVIPVSGLRSGQGGPKRQAEREHSSAFMQAVANTHTKRVDWGKLLQWPHDGAKPRAAFRQANDQAEPRRNLNEKPAPPRICPSFPQQPVPTRRKRDRTPLPLEPARLVGAVAAVLVFWATAARAGGPSAASCRGTARTTSIPCCATSRPRSRRANGRSGTPIISAAIPRWPIRSRCSSRPRWCCSRGSMLGTFDGAVRRSSSSRTC